MRRTIHAIAVGAAVWCCTLSVAAGGVSAGDAAMGDFLADDTPAPIVEPEPQSELAPLDDGDATAFAWSSDLDLAPPPYVVAATDAHFVPPSTSSTAVPLPPAAWTGFASLGVLAGVGLLRRMRRMR